MNVLDLFSGIGGFSLGLERAGMRTVAFCEIGPYQRAVLAKHWPDVPCYDDVQTLTADRLRADGISVDVICGGFPCQDISLAGRGAGITGTRSGLWTHLHRLIVELRPLFALIENSPALRLRGADQVLADLETVGYACEPFVVGAVHAGAKHRRQRAWLVAHPDSPILWDEQRRRSGARRALAAVAGDYGAARDVADANLSGLEIAVSEQEEKFAPSVGAHPWAAEPDVGRVAYGVPARVDRIGALGNSIVPQVAEEIGRAIMNSMQHLRGEQ